MGKKRKSILTLTLLPMLMFLLSFLCGCGKVADTSGLAGSWRLVGAENGTLKIGNELLEHLPLMLRLDPDGKGIASDEESEGRLLWSYDQGTLSVSTGGIIFYGETENNGFYLQPEDSELVLHFAPEQTDSNRYSSEAQSEAYVGNWYGWWKIESEFGQMPTSWYDCCAVLEQGEDGSIVMTLWDEDGSRTAPLAEATLAIRMDGTLESQRGYFLYEELLEGSWKFSQPSPALYLENVRHDANGEQFEYSIYLRKWGDRWTDAMRDQRPFYYDDWYLPLIQSNVQMPDEIPWEDLEQQRQKIPQQD